MQNPATNTTTVTIRSVIRSVTECAIAQGAVKPKPLAQLDAELLLAHVLQKPRSFLLTHPDHRLTTDEHRSFIQLTDCRAIGVPIAYLVGKKEFWSLSF
ncbi:MAG: hypothetical protein HKM24_01210, partial [Gammaproteobacteria bacterium]|nr:hypothetical protein [Gammaproteobacteria bacterium]